MFCLSQLGQLGQIESKLKAAHAVVYCISCEQTDALAKMKKYAKLGDTFVLLSDPDAKAANLYAGHAPDQKTLNPATFVIDKQGKIIFAFQGENIQQRAEAQDVLAAVQKADKTSPPTSFPGK